MDSGRARNFVLAVLVLVSGAAALAVLDRGEAGLPASGARSRAVAEPGTEAQRRPSSTSAPAEAEASARYFAAAYLLYEEGRLDRASRSALLGYSTPEFGAQLAGAPVHVPAGQLAPRQFVARVAGVEASIFDGRPALVASVVIAGSSGTHLLRLNLLERRGTWVVGGVGP